MSIHAPNLAWKHRQPRQTYREPCYTLEEIASRLNVPHSKVRGWMQGNFQRAHPGAPKPQPCSRNSSTHRRYYLLSEFRSWIATFPESPQ